MPDLAELVRDEFQARAAAVVAPDELDGRTHERIDRRVQRRRAAGGGALAVLTLAVVAAAVALPVGRPTVVTSPSQAGDGPLYVTPGWLPDGFGLSEAGGLAQDLPPVRDVSEEGSEVYLRLDDAGQYAAATLTLDWVVGPQAPGAPGNPVEVGDRPGVVDGGVVTWQDHDRLMRLSGMDYTEAGPKHLPVGTLVTAAAAVELGDAGHPVITAPPDGFEGTGAMPEGPSEGVGVRYATYEDGTGRRVTIRVADAVEVPPLSVVDGSRTRRVPVRDHDGALLFEEHPTTLGVSYAGHLAWEERPRTQVTITTQGLEEADIRRVAEELRAVDEETWKTDVLRMEDGTTTTTRATEDVHATDTTAAAATTGTSAAAPTTSAPAISGRGGPSGPDVIVLPLSGTYSGTETFLPGSAECPDMEYVYDGTITDGSGGEWAFHEGYCGRVDGEGTFTMADPAGDELTGTFAFQEPADGDRQPYPLTVTGGTGRYEGATGECRADDHVEQVTPGTQAQSGEITCTIGIPGPH